MRVRAYWWSLPIIITGVVVGGRAWLATPFGKRAVDTVMIKAPQLGPMTRAWYFVTARLVRLLGVLIQGKVPLIDALNLVRESTVNHHYTQLMTRAVDAVTRGESLAGAFADSELVGTSVHEAMRSGERSGQSGAAPEHDG